MKQITENVGLTRENARMQKRDWYRYNSPGHRKLRIRKYVPEEK